MFTKLKEKVNSAAHKIKNGVITMETTSVFDILSERRGSQLVEYAGIALLVLVVIVIVVLPAMKNMFNTDIFPGLTSKIESILSFS